MAKPALKVIASGTEQWDAAITDNFGFVGTRPTVIAEFADLATLNAAYPANQNDRCIAAINDGTAGWVLVMSDGAAWKIIGKQAAAQADSVAPDVLTLKNDFNALLAKLRTAGQLAP